MATGKFAGRTRQEVERRIAENRRSREQERRQAEAERQLRAAGKGGRRSYTPPPATRRVLQAGPDDLVAGPRRGLPQPRPGGNVRPGGGPPGPQGGPGMSPNYGGSQRQFYGGQPVPAARPGPPAGRFVGGVFVTPDGVVHGPGSPTYGRALQAAGGTGGGVYGATAQSGPRDRPDRGVIGGSVMPRPRPVEPYSPASGYRDPYGRGIGATRPGDPYYPDDRINNSPGWGPQGPPSYGGFGDVGYW